MKTNLLFIYGPLGGGGAERVLIDLLSNLDYKRYEVDLCLMVNAGILLPEVPSQVNIITLWDHYNLYYKMAYRESIWLNSNHLFKRVLKRQLKKHYDVSISFLEGMPLKLHAMMATNAKKITWVHCDLYHDHYTDAQFAKGEESKAYQQMDRIICVSNFALKAFEKRFPNCTTKAEVIYNPIDTQRILELAGHNAIAKDQTLTIVTVGRLTHQKKMDRIIRLAARFKKEGVAVRFQIIGDGDLKEELLALRQALKVEEMVEFIGFLRNPYPYIKSADMMLLCSGFEGFGLVICEAMCVGTPVVATKTAGPMEIIGEDQYGLLCEHDDESIYQAVKRMMNDQTLRDYYSSVGTKRAEDFSVQRMMAKFDELTDNLLAT